MTREQKITMIAGVMHFPESFVNELVRGDEPRLERMFESAKMTINENSDEQYYQAMS